MYELKDYLNAINHQKIDLMDSEDEFWEKKYPAFIVNKALSSFPDCLKNLENHFVVLGDLNPV